MLQLVEEVWLELGIKIYTKPLQREVLRNRIFAGSTLMTMWFGLENGIPSADMSPWEFAPTSQQQYQWPKWGQYFETGGEAGEPPDLPVAKELLALYDDWRLATSIEEQRRIWHQYARDQRRAGLLDRRHRRRAAADRGQGPAEQRAAGGDLQLGSGRPARHLPAGHLLVHPVRDRPGGQADPERLASSGTFTSGGALAPSVSGDCVSAVVPP